MLDSFHDRIRTDTPTDHISDHHGVDTEYLGRLLGLPILQPISPDDAGEPFDPFAVDQLDAV